MPNPIADIAVGISVNKTFHYRIPHELRDRIVPGSRVLVPFGSRRIIGTVVGIPATPSVDGLKSVLDVLDTAIAPPLMELARWMADYYKHPLGLTLDALVPGAFSRARPKKKKYVRLSAGPEHRSVRGPKQKELVGLLSQQGETAIDALTGFSRATIKALQDARIIELVEREADHRCLYDDVDPDRPPELMPAQAAAVHRIGEALSAGTFAPFLLHGVTGSGKTEVYLRCIGMLAGTGKGAIVLVPEIALTPQLLDRFRRRFGRRVAVLHSGLTDRERVDEYRRIQSGTVDVVIGARSAVFAPFDRLGLVIVDEEHENSYKQEEGLRYHARDVAVMRAKGENAVALLGSATPSLESYANTRNGKYTALTIPGRVDDRPMPETTVVDVKASHKAGHYSPALIDGIRQRLDRKEQVLLLLNRRGFSSVLICRECGTAPQCPSCSVTLTYHKSDRTLKCHYCNHLAPLPDICPSCNGSALHPLGIGTQKVEEELQALFPGARIARMDSDIVKGRQAYERLLGEVDRREVDILLGTQMVAKGHDFPAVTLVGIVDADVGLNLPDFRSAEKTFQLITQAAGRAGRGETPGEVILQTMNPGHYAITYSRNHDYEGFYEQEIVYRIELGYPPAGRLIRLEFQSTREEIASESAQTAFTRMRAMIRGKDPVLLGPAPAPIAKVRGRYRFQVLLLSSSRERLRLPAVEGKNAAEEKYGRKCRVIVDVDPMSLM